MKRREIADHLSGRDNNFNLIRFLAAALVIYSHRFTVIRGNNFAWFNTGINTSYIGYIAVEVFFVLSGFLVIKSWINNQNLPQFFIARSARNLPALFLVSVVMAFVVGPIMSSYALRDYFADPSTWFYVPRVMAFVADTRFLAFLNHSPPQLLSTGRYGC